MNEFELEDTTVTRDIQKVIDNSLIDYRNFQNNVAYKVNTELLKFYMSIGKRLYEDIENHSNIRGYKERLIQSFSKEYMERFGTGFSRSNIQNFIIFYKDYGKSQALLGNLCWAHFVILLRIKNEQERHYYERQCSKERWSSRTLQARIKTCEYERYLIANNEYQNKNLNLPINTSDSIDTIGDIIKIPFVFDFASLQENTRESEIENSLAIHMKEFIEELGSCYQFVGRQFRIPIKNKNFYADLVFYHSILKAYVIIELKSVPFSHDVVGQINTYLNYFKSNINKSGDNDPIGIVMCTDFEHIQVEYALGNISNQIFVTKYITHLPKKEDLERELLLAQKIQKFGRYEN